MVTNPILSLFIQLEFQYDIFRSSFIAGDDSVRKFYIMLAIMVYLLVLTPAQALAKKAETVFTDYSITLDEAVDIQMNVATNPITDLYKDEPAYVYAKNLRIIGPNKITATIANIPTQPSPKAPIAYHFPQSVTVNIVGIVEGEPYDENPLWYKIAYDTNTYYIHSSLVQVFQVKTTAKTKIYSGPGKQYHSFADVKAGETFTVAQLGESWMQVYYKSWRTPKPEDVKLMLDPNEDRNLFQHIRLDQTIGVSAEEINTILEGKGILEGHGQAFVDGAKKYGINEAYLIAHAFLETGLGASELANGVEVGLNKKKKPTLVTEDNREKLTKIKIAYNMFGIGAADTCPLECGAKTA